MKNIILKMLKELGDDVKYIDCTDETNGYINIMVQDTKGYDKDFKAIPRKYNHPNEVNELIKFIQENGEFEGYIFYRVYSFKDFDIQLGHTSVDVG